MTALFARLLLAMALRSDPSACAWAYDICRQQARAETLRRWAARECIGRACIADYRVALRACEESYVRCGGVD